MSYFRKTPKIQAGIEHLSRDQKWCILINADPDAMASAMALRRIMAKRVGQADIMKVNEISRPDNLAMIRYTRLRMLNYKQEALSAYTHFAIVDSQPSHNPAFEGIKFSIIVDHHPLATEPANDVFMEILPEYGATSTIFTEYLYNLKIRPGHLLATALQFGIRTDTSTFQRNVHEVDMRAYQYLSKLADQNLLNRIMRSEYHFNWLHYFAKASTSIHKAGSGYFAYVGEVDNPDILVVIADFFTRVYEIRWVAVSGFYNGSAIVIFRSDGLVSDVGRMALLKFNDLGSAGGHKTMARAEFPLTVTQGAELEMFIYKILLAPMPRKKNPPAPPAAGEEPPESPK